MRTKQGSTTTCCSSSIDTAKADERSRMNSYRVVDEPHPSGLSQWAVRPLWPLFAQMLAGAWLSWPWFVLNAFALGSATRKREAMYIGAAGLGSVLISILVIGLVGAE